MFPSMTAVTNTATVLCAVPGCNKTAKTRGVCHAHHSRILRGTPLTVPARIMGRSKMERFWSKVARGSADECWPWLGGRGRKGYGVFRDGGINRSHRVAWELTNGPVEEGQQVLHRCDNPPCCNPAHLFLGDNTVNMADKLAKGRQIHGEAQYNAILKATDIPSIRALLRQGVTEEEIGQRYGVSRGAISNIKRKRSWVRVP